MISIQTVHVSQANSVCQVESGPADFLAGERSTLRILCNHRPIATAERSLLENRIVSLKFVIQTEDPDILNEMVETMVEEIQVKYHPRGILCTEYTPELKKALCSHLFFPKGRNLQRLTEPWRQALADYVFDQRGYIINQGEMKQIGFGLFSTREKGCGWIAAWNLLKLCRQEVTMKECAEGLDRHAFMGELFGQDIMSLYFWLKSRDLAVKITPFGQRRVLSSMHNSSCGILLYTHRRGAHYTAYCKEADGRYHFYNAIYGVRNHIMSGEEFMKKYVIPLSLMVITVQ